MITVLEEAAMVVKQKMSAIEPIITNIVLLNMKLSKQPSDEVWGELMTQREQQLKQLLNIVRNPR